VNVDDLPQGRGYRSGAQSAVVRVGRQTNVEHGADFGEESWTGAGERGNLSVSWGMTDQEMPDEGRSAEDIRGSGSRGSREQLRSGVGPRLGSQSRLDAGGKKAFGTAKSAYPDVSRAAYQDVCGVDVTVNQGTAIPVALAMGVGQAIEEDMGHEHGGFRLEWLAEHTSGSGHTVDGESAVEGQHKSQPSLAVQEVMGRENRGVMKPREDGGFTGEGMSAANVVRKCQAQGAEASEGGWPFPYRQHLASESSRAQTANGSIPRQRVQGTSRGSRSHRVDLGGKCGKRGIGRREHRGLRDRSRKLH
jgi:hypothetical protein